MSIHMYTTHTRTPTPNTHTHTHICITEQQQKSMKASRTETGSNSNAETSQLLKHLGLLPSTSHLTTTKSEEMEQVDNTRPDAEKEKETEEKKEEDNGNVIDDSAFLPSERPVQKNKKKCWICKTKLELAQRELGGCKCGKFVCKDTTLMHMALSTNVCLRDCVKSTDLV